jgi:hypothetical protein
VHVTHDEEATMTRRVMLLAAALAAIGGGATSAATGSGRSGFTANVDNPWFPLRPGTVYVYAGERDGKPARDVVTVTGRTKVIDGVPCRAVNDRLYLSGRLRERTTDWYSQDAKGTVWYYSEATAELNVNGTVANTEGSWQAGIDGARAGVFMPAHPAIGDSFRQEFLKGQAEDHFRVIGLFGAPRNGLLTKEWTPLEPGVIDHKLYVRGIGVVVEETIKGGNERDSLVSMRQS